MLLRNFILAPTLQPLLQQAVVIEWGYLGRQLLTLVLALANEIKQAIELHWFFFGSTACLCNDVEAIDLQILATRF